MDTEITRRLLTCMKQEATAVLQKRQLAYDNIMAENGPQIKLLR